MKYFILCVLVIGLCVPLALATGARVGVVPMRPMPLMTGNEVLPAGPVASGDGSYSISEMDLTGDTTTIGTTWYDYQHNGTAGRMIRIDNAGWIHAVWMNGLESGAANRHVYYNMKDNTGWVINGNVGVGVENQTRGGYACLGVNADSYPFPTFHVVTPNSPLSQPHGCVSTDYIPGAGAFFVPWEFPYVVQGGVTLQLIWPKVAVDQQGRLHFISIEQPQSGVAGDPQQVYYCRGTWDPVAQTITFINQVFIEWTEVIASDIAAARHSDAVALTYHHVRQSLANDTTQYNNDVFLFKSDDGTTWDFSHPTANITNFIHPDLGLLPDTLAADKDTLRAYTDASILFDAADNIHVAFTVAWFDEIGGYISANNSSIWHWFEHEGDQYYSLVADGFYDVELRLVNSCGAWQRYNHRPCLAVDESTGHLFMTYQKYDPYCVSSNGYPQGEVMVSRSTDDGMRWSVPTNLTQTGEDSAEAGHGMSERDITCNELIVDDALHILYVLDLDAGGVIQTPQEGIWTRNPVKYHRVDIDDIPTTPLMPRYPMHVDSTGYTLPAGPMPPTYPAGVELTGGVEIPSRFHLAQNYPNPFNPTTKIRFDLSSPDRVTLKIYNIVGQEVATLVDGRLQAGTYAVPFDAAQLASGVYFYKLSSSVQTETRKMVLLK